jgi:hypothetical protein
MTDSKRFWPRPPSRPTRPNALFIWTGLVGAIPSSELASRPCSVLMTGRVVFLEEPVVTAPPETLSVYAPFTYRLILTPRGDFVYVEHWDTEAVTGTMIGLDSGIVWTRTKNLSPYIVRSTGGGMEHYTFKGTFVSDHGPTIEVHEVYHVSYDANGELRVELFKFHARLK